MTRLLLSLTCAVLLTGCGGGVPEPAVLDTANENCAFCRMAVSAERFASQIVAPGEEPLFFDDLGCLRNHLEQEGAMAGATVFVADHRTGEWVRAADAVLTRVDTLQTPMGSHVIAHSGAASRNEDPAAANGGPVTLGEWFGAEGPPDGGRR
jgi:copper chaperone NosL